MVLQVRALKVAVVHDWLVTYGGAERVLEQMLARFPDADLFALYDFIPPGERDFIQNKPVRTSFLQKFPYAKKKYRSYLPLMPLAIEQFDMSSYDLVISSSHAVAKGVLTGPNQLHICMCYSPVRYAWDLTHQYLKESGLTRGLKAWLAKYALHRLRMWDSRTANGVDKFIAISDYIARRIRKVYGRKSTVIYPPVDVKAFDLHHSKDEFYLTASRMVPYKKIGLIVEAFSKTPSRNLIVIGDGPDFDRIRKKAGPNVSLLGRQSFEVLRDHMQRARAFVFAAEEDFGIVPVEAQACGTPVIAYGRGGALETVVDGETGVFFDHQTPESLIQCVNDFESRQHVFDPVDVRKNAMRFSIERFTTEFNSFVDRAIDSHFKDRPDSTSRRLTMRSARHSTASRHSADTT